ncbi:MAG: PASTA domain-containing protein [Planctomycetota bacterium]|nr:PASTA domain-containing protein [Planctomycetota bacterium]
MDGIRIGWRATVLLALLLALPADAHARGGEPLSAKIPDVRRLRTADARRRIEQAGFKLGKVYEVSRERILRTWKVRYPVGYVFMQAPSFTETKPIGTPIHIVVSAARDGPELPPGVRELTEPEPKKAPPKPPPPKADDNRLPPPAPDDPAPEIAEGSPDAPRAAPKGDPQTVPPLVGLDLAQAEQLAREADMKLHVERVAGHPVGRVLEQLPASGLKRPPGGMIKVVVTAGGDFEGERPGAPEVYLAEIEVPNLLDRTLLQARRIIGDLGLRVREEKAKRGLAGRVVDQMPMEGGKVPKGGFVRIWIGPMPEGADDPEAQPPMGPLRAPRDLPAKSAPKKSAPKKEDAPPAPGPLPGGIPAPVAPSVNTEIPKGEAVPVGFTWRGVQGAAAYILEIEEEGAEGRWIANARKTSRRTAVLLEIERLDPKMQKRLRWRVRAVIGGREGKASDWVLLR